jgi:glycosyltransferase involved in cell wall biosynthesis
VAEPKRVVQVSFFVDPERRTPEEMLGAWTGLTTQAEAAALAGLHVTVVQAASVERRVTLHDVDYHFVRARGATFARRQLGRWASPVTPAVTEAVAELEPDVVHLHGLSFPRHTARLVDRLGGVPVVVQDHADRPPPSWRLGSYRMQMGGIRGVLFTTRAQAEPFFASGALPAGLPVFEVLESTSRFTPAPSEMIRLLAGTDGDPFLLWVGRLDANKDPITVLDALSRASSELRHARLWMCYTDAPLLSEVTARVARDPNLSGRVKLLGRRAHSDVQQMLRAADFLVLGSHSEGSGYAVIEALACGTTPLVTDIPSLRRITGDGAVGALSPPGDADAMARAFVEWSRKPRAELRHAAREHFERELSVPAIGEQLRAAYRAVTEGRHTQNARRSGA